MIAQVGIIMGSDSDWPVMEATVEALNLLNVSHEVTIVSAHRTPDRLMNYAKNARTRGLSVIIAGAGGSAHLPGMVAAITELPVIGVPIVSTCLNGKDSLFSIVQMPRGVPVATVAINGAYNAGLLAAQIISINDDRLKDSIRHYKDQLSEHVLDKAKKIESGFK